MEEIFKRYAKRIIGVVLLLGAVGGFLLMPKGTVSGENAISQVGTVWIPITISIGIASYLASKKDERYAKMFDFLTKILSTFKDIVSIGIFLIFFFVILGAFIYVFLATGLHIETFTPLFRSDFWTGLITALVQISLFANAVCLMPVMLIMAIFGLILLIRRENTLYRSN